MTLVRSELLGSELEAVRSMRGKAEDEIATIPTLGIEINAITEDTLERLKALGYTQ